LPRAARSHGESRVSLLKELQSRLPADADITEVKFEASEIVIYTKNRRFFTDGEHVIRGMVSDLKKRVELRPDNSISMDQEKTKVRIGDIVPQDAGVSDVYFEPELGKVVIEAQKPGLVIGKGGETFRRIKNETLWLPKIERAPAIRSDVVRAVRSLLHTELDYRKKFLNMIGQKINDKGEPAREDWVRMTALGGFRQVGRSAVLVQTPKSSVLMDCGADPGSEATPYLDAPEFRLDALDAIVLSHAHIDHCAYIPYLYEKGYLGPLYCTAPTRDLMVLLCMDYIDVCQKEGKTVPYSKKAVEKTVKHTIALNFGEVSDIARDVRLTLQPSGHLLGSSLIHLHIGEGLHNVLYTGDFRFGPSQLLDPAYTGFPRVETLIMESTYGSAEDVLPQRRDIEEELMGVINRAMDKGGKVLIPSFAVERSQEVMAILAAHRFQHPVYMEGMVWDATAIHTAYPEYLSQHLQREIFHYGRNPFLSEMFHRVVPRERDKVIDSSEPAVVIATSGMLVGGPAIEYLKAFAPDRKNTLLFIGYQGEGTLGRRIQKGWKEVPIHEKGRNVGLEIRMDVETVHGLTGHSGRNQLIGFLHRLGSSPERVIVNHGDPKKVMELSRDIRRMFRADALAPKNLESVRLR
jgi:KH/beta-lactamase-domain protein